MPDLSAVKKALEAQRIELPSWAFGDRAGGTAAGWGA